MQIEPRLLVLVRARQRELGAVRALPLQLVQHRDFYHGCWAHLVQSHMFGLGGDGVAAPRESKDALHGGRRVRLQQARDRCLRPPVSIKVPGNRDATAVEGLNSALGWFRGPSCDGGGVCGCVGRCAVGEAGGGGD